MSHGPGPRLIGHAFYGTDGSGRPLRDTESRHRGERRRAVGRGTQGGGALRGREGRGTVEGHGGEGRRREQGATWWHHAPSRHCPCEGGIVHWKQEDEELGLSQGNLEEEEVPGGSLERSAVIQ